MDGDFGNDSADAAGAYKLFVVRIVLVLVLYLRHCSGVVVPTEDPTLGIIV
jgi:hypothetical protein